MSTENDPKGAKGRLVSIGTAFPRTKKISTLFFVSRFYYAHVYF